MVLYRTLLASALFLSFAIVSLAQAAKTTPAVHKPAGTSAPAAVALKTTTDSLSYAIGLSVANFYKQYNITNINTALVTRAINDVNKKGKMLMDDNQAQACVTNYVMRSKAEKAAGPKKEGQEFLAANRTKPGVVALPSGLQYSIIKAGTGPKPAITDVVRVHYHGTLINGKVFDSSIESGRPVELAVNGVIAGWTEALQLMPVGSKWKLFVPSDLAYGDQSPGEAIPAGSTLIFDVELLSILKQPGAANSTDSTGKSN